VVVALLLCGSALVEAQSLQSDLALLLKKRPAPAVFNLKNEAPPAGNFHRQVSEAKLLFSGLIRAYQIVLSSQDVSACNFVPSCSRFGSAALEQAGLLRGVLITSDRLQRCNGLPGIARHYEYLPSYGKFVDPIERYTRPSVPDDD
jgi:putative component of membrane protein insertase Oxa1/YidC/SpoIIIJ protein YidD